MREEKNHCNTEKPKNTSKKLKWSSPMEMNMNLNPCRTDSFPKNCFCKALKEKFIEAFMPWSQKTTTYYKKQSLPFLKIALVIIYGVYMTREIITFAIFRNGRLCFL